MKIEMAFKKHSCQKTIITRGLYWCKLISCHSLRSITSNSNLPDSLHSQVRWLFSTHPMAFILLFCVLRLEFPQEPHSSLRALYAHAFSGMLHFHLEKLWKKYIERVRDSLTAGFPQGLQTPRGLWWNCRGFVRLNVIEILKWDKSIH